MVTIQEAKVVKQGTSNHIILPSWFCKKHGIKKGDIMNLSLDKNENLIIAKKTI